MSVITVIGRIRIVDRWWVWGVIIPVFTTLFLLIASLFLWWRVWQLWFWVRVIWCMPFLNFLWQFRWSCQWLRIWNCEMLFSIFRLWNGESWSSHRNILQCRSIHRHIFQCWLSHRNIFQCWSSNRNIFQNWSSYRIISKVGRVTEKFSSSKTSIVSKSFFLIVDVQFFPAHSFHRNFLNIMHRRKPDGAICQPINSGFGADDRL